ncbi:hypothetical protein ALON55S_01589 [Alishewanella longhuensis]
MSEIQIPLGFTDAAARKVAALTSPGTKTAIEITCLYHRWRLL